MGASGSSPATPIVVESGIADPHFDQKTSGVRITTAATEEKVDTHVNFKAAYDKGHEDGVNTFQSSLELVAAQVYDGVHKQLADIQTDSLKRSKQLAEDVQKKLTVPGSFGKSPQPCANEQSILLTCLQNSMKNSSNSADSLACKEAVDAYSRCAMSP